jgi:hypothetical protein
VSREQLEPLVRSLFDRQPEAHRHQGIFIGETHNSPITRAYISHLIGAFNNPENSRPLTHLFVELPSDYQPMLDRFMAREAGSEAEFHNFLSTVQDDTGFYELVASARDHGVRVVAMDLPSTTGWVGGGRLVLANPYWQNIIQSEIRDNANARFMVLGGGLHGRGVGLPTGIDELLDIPSIHLQDVYGAEFLQSAIADVPSDVPDAENMLRGGRNYPISVARMEGAMTTASIQEIEPGRYSVILPSILGFDYPSRDMQRYMSEDLRVYENVLDAVGDMTLNERGIERFQRIVERLSSLGQASLDSGQKQLLSGEIHDLAEEIGRLSPSSVSIAALNRLADSVDGSHSR